MKIRKIFRYTILILCSLSMLLPFFIMVSTSLIYEGQLYSSKIMPSSLTFQNYLNVFHSIPLGKYLFNSLFVAILTTFGQVLFSSMAGYFFARSSFKYKEHLFLGFLITMMIPPQVNIIPLFFIFRELNLINTYQALIIPGLFGGFGVFLMRQFFKGLPKSLEESAKLDGCSNFEIFFKIAVPLALPAIMTLGVFTFITSYNSFMWPLIVTSSESLRTLPLGIAEFKGSFRETIQWTELCAASVVSVIPALLVFLAGKKYFINDILSGAIKE